MAGRLTAAEAAFARCMAVLGHHFTLRDVERNRMQADYEAARRSGFYQSAGIESSVKGEDWANSGPGRVAIEAARPARG